MYNKYIDAAHFRRTGMQELLTTAFNAIALLSAAYLSIGLLIHLIKAWRSLQLEEKPAAVATAVGLVNQDQSGPTLADAERHAAEMDADLTDTVQAPKLGSDQPVDHDPSFNFEGDDWSEVRGRLSAWNDRFSVA